MLSFIGIIGNDAADSTKTDSGESNSIDSSSGETNGNINTNGDLHPGEVIGTYALTDATRNAGISEYYSASFTDYTVTFYEDGTYSEQGTVFHWDGTDEGKKYGETEQVNEQGKWVFKYVGVSYDGATLQPSDDYKGIINMGENNFLKSVGDDPIFYTFHFYIAKDKGTFDAYSTQGNYTKYYKKVS